MVTKPHEEVFASHHIYASIHLLRITFMQALYIFLYSSIRSNVTIPFSLSYSYAISLFDYPPNSNISTNTSTITSKCRCTLFSGLLNSPNQVLLHFTSLMFRPYTDTPSYYGFFHSRITRQKIPNSISVHQILPNNTSRYHCPAFDYDLADCSPVQGLSPTRKCTCHATKVMTICFILSFFLFK